MIAHALVNLWKTVRYAAFLLARVTVLGDRRVFYARFFGCDNKALLLLKNLVNPARIVSKVQYGTIALLPAALRKGEPAPRSALTPEAAAQAGLLRQQGYLIFDGARPDMADHFLQRYAAFFAFVGPSAHYYDLVLRSIDQAILAFITDDKLLGIMAAYYNGRQPFLREAAVIKCTWPVADRESTRRRDVSGIKFAIDWHYDTVNMLQIHFLLHDLTPGDTHMALVANQARTHRVPLTPLDYEYSDEYIALRYQTVPLVGRKGTIVLWDSNAPHAAIVKKDRPRHMVQILYSPGNDILTLDPRFGKDFGIAAENLDLRALPEISRGSLKHLLDDRPPDQRLVTANARKDGTVFADEKGGVAASRPGTRP